MKRSQLVTLIVSGLLALLSVPDVQAESLSLSGEGSHLSFNKTLTSPKKSDPEKPEVVVNPGETPSTAGYLRLDVVPTLTYGRNKISTENQSYAANAQLFHGETKARGNYVQVTDERGTATGWTLQVRQEQHFTSQENASDMLKGAFLSFDKAWANSTMDKKYTPTLQSDVIKLENVGETYDLAKASINQGVGTWTIAFGASKENREGLSETLSPLVDENGNAVIDSQYNKPIEKNSAVTLFLPGDTEKKAVRYQTVLTWIISELP